MAWFTFISGVSSDNCPPADGMKPTFWDMDNNDDHFPSALDLLCYFFNDGKPPKDEQEFWQRVQNVYRNPFDPLRIVYVDYRPFEKKCIYYSDSMGLISHPRFGTMRNILPWYFRFTVRQLAKRMSDYSPQRLCEIIQQAESDWFELPLNAKFLSNLNIWRTAICLKSIPAKQLSLFS